MTGFTLTTQPPAYLTILISWPAQSDATSYDIDYTDSLQPGDNRINVTGTSTSIDTIPGATICVQMRAVNKYGQSAWYPTSPDCVENL